MRTLLVFPWMVLLSCAGTPSPGSDDDDAGPSDDDDAADDDDTSPPEPVACPDTVGGDRPAAVLCPEDWIDDEELPLVVLLHGYGVNAEIQDTLWRLSPRVEPDRFVLLLPNGTVNPDGAPFWNATPGCCNSFGSDIDDVGYLMGLVDQLGDAVPLDDHRLYFTGHSNGGFMSYRMACEHPDRIAAIASLAGSTFLTAAECAVGDPVPVLQIHGTLDTTIPYDGWPGAYPSAPDTVERWAERAGCDLDAAATADPLDLMLSLAGDETSRLIYAEGCLAGYDMQLWTLANGPHVPIPNDDYSTEVVRWLFAH
jgi:polyhydroxybutyrate depolymerase